MSHRILSLSLRYFLAHNLGEVDLTMKQVFGYTLLVGIITILWGSAVLIYQNSRDMTGVMIAFGIGSIFALLLLYAIIYELRKFHRRKVVLEDYSEIMTTLMRVEKFGEEHFYVHTKWIDPDGGAQYFFKSDYILFNPEPFLKGKKIPVKISNENYKLYYVDLSFLPKVAS